MKKIQIMKQHRYCRKNITEDKRVMSLEKHNTQKEEEKHHRLDANTQYIMDKK